MSGTMIVGQLLRESADLTDAVAPENIKAGDLPDNAPLPSILLRTVSVIDRQPLKRGAKVRQTERVAATVRATNYRDQKAIIGLIKLAAAGKTGTVGDFTRTATLSAGTGPDARGPGSSFEQTQDFRVSFDGA